MPESRRHRSSSARISGKPGSGKPGLGKSGPGKSGPGKIKPGADNARPVARKTNRKTGLHGKSADTAFVPKPGKKGTQKLRLPVAADGKDSGTSDARKALGARKRETTSVKMKAVGKTQGKRATAKSKTTTKTGSDRKKQKGGETSAHAVAGAVAREPRERGG